MATIPTVTGAEIEARVGAQSFRRGLGYFRHHALFHLRRQGNTIRAQCQGSADEPYRLEVTFGEHGIAAAECSCPVGHGGYCKHIAALLLAWEASPDEFIEVEELNQALDRRSRPELIALIKQMLRRAPELETLLELPLPTGDQPGAGANPEVFRREAAAAFADADPSEWGVEAHIASEIAPLLELAEDFAAHGDLASAAAVYQGVATEVVANYERFPNDEGDLSSLVESCDGALFDLLDRPTTDAAARLAVLRALFEVYHEGATASAEVNLAHDVGQRIVRHATPDERHQIAGWVRAAIAADAGSPGDDEDVAAGNSYLAKAYQEFLFDLEADTLGDEEFIRRARALDRTDDLVERLLTVGRIDEATAEARQGPDHVLLRLADRFVATGHAGLGETLLAERSRTSPAPPILTWLSERYAARGEYATALELAERGFTLAPSLESYRRVRELARHAGRWEMVRAGLRSILSQPSYRYLLVETYLDDGDLDRAIEAVRPTSSATANAWSDPYGAGYGLALRVAQAAETTRPRDALEIYRDHAERLIDLRGRGNYQSASQYLRKVRDLCDRLGERAAWQSYIADLRTRHRTLRAFQEELTLAGL
jgi:tetratricopeptide (TPR) repeat protein